MNFEINCGYWDSQNGHLPVLGVFVLRDVVEGADVVTGISPVSVGVVKIQNGAISLFLSGF